MSSVEKDQAAQGRSKEQRKRDTLKMLATEIHLWLATASGDLDAHLIPMTFAWDGKRLTMATLEDRKTARNLRRTGRARAAIGTTHDVVIVEGTVTFDAVEEIDPPNVEMLASRWRFDPRHLPGCVFFQLHPKRIQAYRPGGVENSNRTLMKDGEWLI